MGDNSDKKYGLAIMHGFRDMVGVTTDGRIDGTTISEQRVTLISKHFYTVLLFSEWFKINVSY